MLGPPYVGVRETLTGQWRWELDTFGWPLGCSGQDVAAVLAQSTMDQPCWWCECETIPLHLRKQHFWGVHFTPLHDFLLTNLVWCSVFRFRILFFKMLWSEIFEILLKIITLKIMLSDICKQIVPLVSLIVPNALLTLNGFLKWKLKSCFF